MSSHLVLSGVDDAVKARLEKYWEKKLPRLEKLLVPYRTDLQGDPADRQPSPAERAGPVVRGPGRHSSAHRYAGGRGERQGPAGRPGPHRGRTRHGDQAAQGAGPARLRLQAQEGPATGPI